VKFVCSSRGSRGDVFPIIEIASILRNAGHEVRICVPGIFEEECRRRGLSVSLYPEDSTEVMRSLQSGLPAWKNALAWVSRAIDDQFAFMMDESSDADAMVTSVNEFIAPTVAVYRRVPHFRIAYTPVLPGYHPPPLVPWQKLPGLVNRALWGVVNFSAAIFVREAINEKRRHLGMAPIHDTPNYFLRDSYTLLAISPVLGPPCRTWHGKYRYAYTGCCHPFSEDPIDPDLSRFLDDGPPPVYIGFGSVSVKDPESFTAMAIEAVRMAGCRAILGAGWTGLGAAKLPDEIYLTGDTNHAALFPRCAGVAHHGGSGTTHTAARAGVPQFIMPQIADQFYWGARVHGLGLGPPPIPPKRLTAARLARALAAVASGRYREAARRVADQIACEPGAVGAAALICAEACRSKKKGNNFQCAGDASPERAAFACE